MSDYELRHHFKKIEDELEKLNKDKFLSNFYDGVVIGVTVGFIQFLSQIIFSKILGA